MLLIFGAFSWYPIVRTVIMSLQHTNLVQPATWVGLAQLQRPSSTTRCFPIAVKNTADFALLALIFGYPIPLVAAVLMSEVRRRRGALQRARLPAGRDPAGRRRAALEDVLRRQPDRRLQHDPRLGRPRARTRGSSREQTALPSLVLESTWANAGGTVIIYLAALTGVNHELYEAAAVDGAGLWRKVWHITLPQLRGVLLSR